MRVSKIRFRGKSSAFSSLAVAMTMLAASIQGAQGATPISAKAALDKKTQKLVISGKTTGLAINSLVNVYDQETHRLVYAGQTDSKGSFKFVTDQDRMPCMLEVQSGVASAVVKVGGADKLCTAKPVCTIAGGDRNAEVGGSVSFQASYKASKSKPLQVQWDFGDGAAAGDLATTSHAFKGHGAYLVTMTGTVTDKTGAKHQCSDAVTVSVAPPAGTNPNATVTEPVARPAKAAGMPTANGGNDENALVVFPFEEMGMEGGSQINIPFNALYPYNAMNAQVIQKIPEKPQILSSGAVGVYYSAAINPKDPAGADSINSTSQNLFEDGPGANYDTATSSTNKTVYNDDHAYDKAQIAKTELWDKIHQPNAKVIDPVNGVEKGLSQADQQNSWSSNPAKPMVKPDQGIVGNSDNAVGIRSMPGITNPYQVNEPQPLAYSADQQAFVAQNIPMTPIDDKGRNNPFPLLRVEAREGSETVAATDAVYTTASETGCAACHYKGGKGADDTVWRTPVTINELVNPDGTPGPATGKGAFPLPSGFPETITLTEEQQADPVLAFKAPIGPSPTPLPSATPVPAPTLGYGPAIHQTFVGDKFVLDTTKSLVANNIVLEYDENGVRKDRVVESRWLKPDGTTQATNPTKDPSWKLQIRLKFKDSSAYGEDTWQNREKAARWNTMLLHDYMTPINYNNARDDVFAEIADDKYTTRNTVTMCASHHTSTLRYDVGSGAISTTTTLSQYTRTHHAFHGKMQVYKRDVSAAESADKKTHQKGELIRDERGHPIMWGGRGWDSVHMDEEGLYLSKDAEDKFTVKKAVPNFAERNNWDPVQFPKHLLGEEMLPVGENIPMEKNCLTCHTGKTEKSYRDVHHAAGLKCDSCHGDMMAVGLVYPHESYNGNRTIGGALGEDKPDTLTAVDFRRQWIDEPDCGSCHVGDANLDKDGEAGLNHYYSAGALKQAWADGDKAAATIFPVNARFAVMPTADDMLEKFTNATTKLNSYVPRKVSSVLYRKSADVHGSGSQKLYCSTCHGGSHGLWPNKDPNANDNVTSQQLQGYDGNIAECSTCHVKDDFKTGKVATAGPRSVAQGYREGDVVAPTTSGKAFLAGPHGMHPVGDKYWYEHAEGAAANTAKGKHNPLQNGGWHNDMAKKPGPNGEDQCAACHGADHKGTRLSRSLTERTLSNAKGKPIKIAKDQIIGCDLCHSLQTSFNGVPTGQIKLDPPPLPYEIENGAAVGGGGHH